MSRDVSSCLKCQVSDVSEWLPEFEFSVLACARMVATYIAMLVPGCSGLEPEFKISCWIATLVALRLQFQLRLLGCGLCILGSALRKLFELVIMASGQCNISDILRVQTRMETQFRRAEAHQFLSDSLALFCLNARFEVEDKAVHE